MTAVVVVVAVGIGFVVLLTPPVRVVSAAALTGGGVGYALYRIVFGLVVPVPEYRLENEREDESPGPGDDLP